MVKRVFISFKAEGKQKVDGLRLLVKNPNYDLEFYDESVRFPINSVKASYVKSVIKEKKQRAGAVLCLVNTDTHTCQWVCWELETLSKPIVAMAVKRSTTGNTTPAYSWESSVL